jgi:putative DNA primase/helicase
MDTKENQAHETERTEERDTRPTVVVSNTTAHTIMSDVLGHVVQAQRPEPRLFTQRGGVWVRLRDGGRGELEVLSAKSLKYELDRMIRFLEITLNGSRKVKPPTDLVDGILTSDRFPDLPELPELRRIAEAPFFTKDGDLVMEPGYHAGARTYLRLPQSLLGMSPPSTQPSRAEVEAAKRALVEDVFVDFPFEAPSSRAHALALLITPFVREIIGAGVGGAGSVPMAAIIAPSVGSGKTKIAHAVSLIVTGEPAPVMSMELAPEEVEKRITALLLSAVPYAVFDNAVGKIDSPSLAALLTSDVWRGRILGQTKIVSLPNATQWIVTGNNLEFTDEIARRALTIALDPKMEKPNLRTGFKHDPLEGWIKQARPMLVSSILTLVQHWLAQGRPEFTARTLGSYEAYVQIVGGILQAAELDEGFLTATLTERPFDFASSGKPPKDADEDLLRFVKDWERTYGWQLVDSAKLLEIVARGFCTAPGVSLESAKDKRTALGKFVQRNQGRTIGGFRIEPGKIKDENYRERNAWKLVDVKYEARTEA